MAAKKKFYVVKKGRKPGIYQKWFGPGGAHEQIDGFRGAVFRGFPTRAEAEKYQAAPLPQRSYRPKKSARQNGGAVPTTPDPNCVVIYTDGGALGNPGPGGYGIVVNNGTKRTELSGGYRLTTNNRMELMACIVGLEQLNAPTAVQIFSDSRYVVDGITKGWARRWKRNDWMRTKTDRAINPDLWDRLLRLCDRHDVAFVWVKGHAGNPENERCDQLAVSAAKQRGLPPDEVYEAVKSAAGHKRT